MKQKANKFSKYMLVVAASITLASCGSIGGFNELLGINNEGIDAENVEVNDPLKNANGDELPTPQGGAIAPVSISAPNIVAPKIVAPKIVAPTIVKPVVVASTPKVTPIVTTPIVTTPIVTTPVVKVTPIVTTPIATTPVVTTPKIETKPIVTAKVEPVKFSPLAYKFVDLFTFRSDMRAGKLLNPLATAKRVSVLQPDSCKLEGLKFTCGEYFIMIK